MVAFEYILSSTPNSLWWAVGLSLVVLMSFVITLPLQSKCTSWETIFGDSESRPPSTGDELQDTLHWLGNTQLAIRAGNRRSGTLKKVYCLHNPFTSDSQAIQTAYRNALLNNFKAHCSESWDGIARTVASTIQSLILRNEDGLRCNIKEVCRRAALAACLKSLFDIDNVDPIRLDYIGTKIHRLMVGKKNFDKGASSEKDMVRMAQDLQLGRDRLVDNLRDLFLEAKNDSPLARSILCEVSGTDTESNPLNLIIPAFEAPWRSIHYTVLALLQQNTPERYRDIESMRDCQTAATFSPRAFAVTYESLRLYPPIRRVRREIQVDIEVIQRHPRYWGPRSTKWDSSRFLNKDGSINNRLTRPTAAWMPFVVGSMKCPSANGYSTRMMIVTVGEILKEVLPIDAGTEWRLEGPEWDMDDMNGQPLRPGRDEYSSVQLFVPK